MKLDDLQQYKPDVWEIIQTALDEAGCIYTVEMTDIVYVRTPEGDYWDFTLPMMIVHESRLDRARRLLGWSK